MALVLNSKQAEGLSDFLFDIAKGTLLAAMGFSLGAADAAPVARLGSLTGGITMTYFCIKNALSLLEEK